VTRIEISCHAAADPASVALLLSEPAAQPAVHRVDQPMAELGPVRRSGVGFTAAVDVAVATGQQARGQLRVVPSVDAGCDVQITLSPAQDSAGEAARVWARGFLDSLAERARVRACAA
jgi:hypothetical protein